VSCVDAAVDALADVTWHRRVLYIITIDYLKWSIQKHCRQFCVEPAASVVDASAVWHETASVPGGRFWPQWKVYRHEKTRAYSRIFYSSGLFQILHMLYTDNLILLIAWPLFLLNNCRLCSRHTSLHVILPSARNSGVSYHHLKVDALQLAPPQYCEDRGFLVKPQSTPTSATSVTSLRWHRPSRAISFHLQPRHTCRCADEVTRHKVCRCMLANLRQLWSICHSVSH